MSEFLNADFNKIGKVTGIDKVTSESATTKVNSLAAKSDLNDALGAGRDFRDMLTKSKVITQGMIESRDAQERQALEKENQRIQSYQDLAAISMTAEKIYGLVDKGVSLLGSLITTLTPAVNKMADAANKFLGSPMVRGIKGLFGGKDGE